MYTIDNFLYMIVMSITFATIGFLAIWLIKKKITEIIENAIKIVERYLDSIDIDKFSELRKILDSIDEKHSETFFEKNRSVLLHKTFPLVNKYTCDIEYFLYLIYDIFDKIIDKRSFLFRCGIDRDLMRSIELCRGKVKDTIREYGNLNLILLKYYPIDRSEELINSYERIYAYFMSR